MENYRGVKLGEVKGQETEKVEKRTANIQMS